MKTTFLLSCILALVLKTSITFGQAKPYWTRTTPVSKDSGFQYFVGFGVGNSGGAALEKAEANAVGQLVLELGASVDVETISRMRAVEKDQNIETEEKIDRIIKVSGHEEVKGFKQIERFPTKEKKKYRYLLYVLVRQGHTFKPDNFKELNPRGWALIPTWGQFYKKEKPKGWAFVGSAAAVGAGYFVCKSVASGKYSDAKLHDTNYVINEQLNREGDNWKMGANVGVIIGSSLIYAISLIDAWATPGPRLYTENPRRLEIKQHYAGNITGVTLTYPLTFNK